MLAERVVELRWSRRWLLAASLVAHAAVIAAVIAPRYERVPRPLPEATCVLLAPPRPPRADHCVLWAGTGDLLECAAYRDSPSIPPACPAPAVLREAAPVGVELVRATQLVRTAGSDVALPGRAVVALCVAPDGRVTWTAPLRSTGDACVDQRLAVVMRTWRYEPLGYAACAEVTVR